MVQAAFNGEINDIESAVLLIQACLAGVVKQTTKRLDKVERNQISNGDCFVFVEGETDIKRWTDGKSWGPSRVQDNFLVYKEADEQRVVGTKAKRTDKTLKPNGFKKKCISILVDGKSCHLICYYKDGPYKLSDFKTDARFHGLKLKPFKVLTTGLTKKSSLDSKFENELDKDNFSTHPLHYENAHQFPVTIHMKSSSTLAGGTSDNYSSDSDSETNDELFPSYPSSYLTR